MIGVSVLLAIGAILIFVLFVLFAIRSTKKNREEKIIRARQLGFEPVAEVPQDLQRRIEDLYGNKRNRTLEIRNLHQRREWEQDLYLFDLLDTADEDTRMGTDVFGVISRNLALPRFSLITMPSFGGDGMLGNLMEKILDKVFAWAANFQGLSRVEFPDQSGLDDRFVVFGRDEYAVKTLLSESVASGLYNNKLPLQLAGLGDFLTLETAHTTPAKDQDQDLRDLHQACLDLVRLFEERG